jgi:atrial natriuretic peptide receptor A
MIAAEELNMINGEYVFFNVEIFASLKKDSKPWFVAGDSEERNQKAKKAYQALLTITSKKPEDEEYNNFSNQVRMKMIASLEFE